ncbi:hypothetical protein [Streptomyces nigrescens]|uniref:TetR family transcriptional regulator n=1 Tax=Streptomyces nigrescens TaxID=1920 RepID=A0ABY7J1F4_STRNI|nr:hypothetical protein [Streptomyces nigrescens]WAU04122.1 hypothetical protein STRNI_002356 [Streptomyces nigrescens]
MVRTSATPAAAGLMVLFYCTKVVGRWADEADPKLAPARIAAERIVGELQAR